MDAQRSSALMEWSAWTSQLLGWGLSVEPALPDTQETRRSAMVNLINYMGSLAMCIRFLTFNCWMQKVGTGAGLHGGKPYSILLLCDYY